MTKREKVWKWIKCNYFKWILELIRIILVAILSYFILKQLQKFDLLDEFWTDYERYFLSSFVSIQIIVKFLFYTLIGKAFEELVKRWINKNREEYIIELESSDKKEVKEYVNSIVEFIVRLKLLSAKDFEVFTNVTIEQDEYWDKWKNSVDIIKRLFGIFLLVILNISISPSWSEWFWWITVTMIVVGILSFVGLLAYAVIVENLKLVNLAIKSVAVSGRLARKKQLDIEDPIEDNIK